MPHDRISLPGYLLRAAAAMVLAAGLSACSQEEEVAQEPVRPVKTVVATYTAAQGSGSLVGEVAPRIESSLGFRTGGKLAERLVDVGDVVEAGAVLARLDPAQAQNALRQAEAAVASVRAQNENAEQNERRQRELAARGIATQSALDAAIAQLNVARADLTSAEAALSDARDNMGYMELKADSAGVVTAVEAEVGQVVSAGQTVVQLARMDQRDAVFQVPESLLNGGSRDVPVTVSLLDDPALTAAGRVREISPVADPVTRTFRVKVALDDPPEQFRFGSSVRGAIELPGGKIAALPLSALFNDGDKPAVWVVDPSGDVRLTVVDAVRYEADSVLVSDGVSEGDHVVVAGVQRLRPGMKVRLIGSGS